MFKIIPLALGAVMELAKEVYENLTTPVRRPARMYARPCLEGLEERWCPAVVNMYWDPTFLDPQLGYIANSRLNWDTGSLGSGVHPAAAPGETNGETDNIYFDGTVGKGGNKNCTWNYEPPNELGSVTFQNGWNQAVTFLDKDGFSVSVNSAVTTNAAPTLKPDGSSGANAVAAISLTNDAEFQVTGSSTLFLSGYSSGNAIFFSEDGGAGEDLINYGTVTYTGKSNSGANPYVDYLGIPVDNEGVFNVNGSGDGTTTKGSVLQVSGTDATITNGVSFYQNTFSTAETDIYGNGTLWCVNDYQMATGLLQTKDSYVDYLKVGTGGSTPVDGTVTLTGGTVNINPNGSGTTLYGTLDIAGTTASNEPNLNVGSATLNFKVSMTALQNDLRATYKSDQLFVGKSGGSGKVNFAYNGGNSTVGIKPQGAVSSNHKWNVLFFGTVTNKDKLTVTTGYTPNWSNLTYLEIDN